MRQSNPWNTKDRDQLPLQKKPKKRIRERIIKGKQSHHEIKRRMSKALEAQPRAKR